MSEIVKCNCRWACYHHTFAMSSVGPNDPGLCPTMTVEGMYVRVMCPMCSDFRIYPLCDLCWDRVQYWIRMGSMYSCESCKNAFMCADNWTTYEDVKT